MRSFFITARNCCLPVLQVYLFVITLVSFSDTSVIAQTSAKEQLKKGIEQYENAQFELVIETLKQALQIGLEKKSDNIKAYNYLAFSFAAIGNIDEAKNQFIQLLDIDPSFDLPLSESPKLRASLELAKREFFARYPNKRPTQIAKKGSKKWVWIGIGTAAVGGGIAVVLASGVDGAGTTSGPERLPDPPGNPGSN